MNTIALDFPSLSGVPRGGLQTAQQPAMKGLRKRVWLLLYTEGGTWTAGEITKRLMPSLVPRKLYSMLGEMCRDGFLVRRHITNIDGETVVKYGVAGTCGIPRGVALEEIEQLLRLALGKRA